MNIPQELKYAESHEWVRTLPDGTLSVGISDHAQAALGDLVFIELPAVGRKVAAAEACATVESVKAASDIYAPVAGEVTAVNEELTKTPEKLNENAYEAWLFKLKPTDPGAAAKLLDAAAYEKLIA